MRGVLLAAAVVGAAVQSACAQAPAAAAAAPALAKTDWTIVSTSCPAGCSAELQGFLHGQVGQHVTLAPGHAAAPFADPCDGAPRYELHAAPAAEVVAEVNKGVAPGHRRLAVADLHVAGDGPVTTGRIVCGGVPVGATWLRLLVVEPARVVMLYEEQSLVELH